MKSSGVEAFAPLVDLVDPFETRDLVEGDFGMGLDLEDIFLSFPGLSPFCFLIGESPLLKVKVLLRGRSRFEDAPDVVVSSDAFPSWSDPSRDFRPLLIVDLFDFFPAVSPTVDCADVAREMVGASSLCVRTKSALTSSFKVRIAAR